MTYCQYKSHRTEPESSTKPTPPAPSAESNSAAPAIKPASSDVHEQVVTPWDVQGSVSTDGKQLAIDYDKLVDQFGTRRVDAALLERFERLTGQKPHIMLRRGMFFSHRYVPQFIHPKIRLIGWDLGILIKSWIGMNKGNRSTCILGEDRVAIACIWVI